MILTERVENFIAKDPQRNNRQRFFNFLWFFIGFRGIKKALNGKHRERNMLRPQTQKKCQTLKIVD